MPSAKESSKLAKVVQSEATGTLEFVTINHRLLTILPF